jgi:hypothetical protein
MYVERDIGTRSFSHCRHGNAKTSLYFSWRTVHVLVAVNYIKGFGGATERKQVIPFALLSSYQIFRSAVKNEKLLKSARKDFDSFVGFEPNLGFLDGFL